MAEKTTEKVSEAPKSDAAETDTQASEVATKDKKSGAAKAAKSEPTKDASAAASSAEAQGWLCVHCGHRFEAAEEPKRCPSCMRKGGLEKVAATKTRAGTPAWVIPAAVVGVVAALGVGYALWNERTPDVVEGEAPLEPLSTSQLRGYLRNAHADGDQAELFAAGDALEELAEHATGGDAEAKAAALVAFVRERAEAQTFVRWELDQPRELRPKRAEWAAGEILRGERRKLYPLEVALATTAALREAGVDAMVAEVWSYPDERRPPEPAGHFGYFGVAVYPGAVGEGEPSVLDPYAGRTQVPEASGYRVLTDVQAAGALFGHEALYALVQEHDASGAMSKAERALALDPRSPAIRTVRGAVLLASGGIEEGVDEFRAAARIREDPPRRNNLGAVLLATGDVEAATREISAALADAPDFANAHANLGAIYLSESELDRARAEFVTAERLAPELGTLPMLFAQLHMRTGEPELAAQRAGEAVERRPRDWQIALNAAQVYRAVGRYDEMRGLARRVMELVDDSEREQVRQLIERALGPTALEEEEPLDLADLEDEFDDEVDGLDELPDPDALGGGLQLGGGSSLFGGDDAPSLLGGDDSPSLLGGDQGGLQLGDPGGLQLRDPGSSLQLEL